MKITQSRAEAVALAVLEAAGVPTKSAQIQAGILIQSEMRGLASHGLLRLPRIVERIRNGVANPVTTGTHVWRSQSLLESDGESGLGPVVAMAAIEAITERARQTGIALAAISNSGHLGAIGCYAEDIARSGQLAIVLSTSEALVHPWGGRKAMLGTNPIAVGVPADPEPFVLDMATGLISMGKVHDHANRGVALQPGWALDGDGNPTTDPVAAKSGAIAPFGEAKGYGLALAFELLVASLTRSAVGTDVVGTLDSIHPANKGDLIIVIEPRTGVAELLNDYLKAIRACPPLEPEKSVSVPGDGSRARRAMAMTDGFAVPEVIWSQLLSLAGMAAPLDTPEP
ncbi:Ldh family oxidoreductase [Devosia sp. RR2S18]|uniref:Ldh family oxidoreductase n=1 Tax=Devosia rhizosphaerae TaxID=3049774 RepID=UPI002540686A|nr:Ldh family oxidoreductase [Devosia sp. RR2S18]WIJ25819.1 Ldh family oxidoreductase [Devosia sp. RR2S18]